VNANMIMSAVEFSEFEARALEFYLGVDVFIMLCEMGPVGYVRGREILQGVGFYE